MSRVLASTPAVLKDGTLAPWLRDLLLYMLNDSAPTPTLDAVTDEGATTTNTAEFGGLTVGGDDVYHEGNLLGTVSQSGGNPTGAAIERGSNASGEYVRFADGTQICTHRFTVSTSSGTSVTRSWTFPKAFASTTGLFVSATQESTAADRYLTSAASHSTAAVTIAVFDSFGSVSLPVRLFAVGRWF